MRTFLSQLFFLCPFPKTYDTVNACVRNQKKKTIITIILSRSLRFDATRRRNKRFTGPDSTVDQLPLPQWCIINLVLCALFIGTKGTLEQIHYVL